ncbi:MAG: hypothetical protein ACXWTU_00460 [Methylotenera sp.]
MTYREIEDKINQHELALNTLDNEISVKLTQVYIRQTLIEMYKSLLADYPGKLVKLCRTGK